MDRALSNPACIYCRAAPASEEEHVFPNSWYPDTTPTGLARLKVPSCGRCNDEWERVERRLGQELAMALSPGHPASAGVIERLTRAWQPERAKNEKDREHRLARLRSVERTMKWLAPVPGKTQVSVQTPAGLYLRATPARLVDAPFRRRMAEKLIRGIHYAETGTPLGDVVVHAKMVINEPIPPDLRGIEEILGSISPNDRLAPGLSYKRIEAGSMALWAFLVWDQVLFIAFAAPPGAEPAADSS